MAGEYWPSLSCRPMIPHAVQQMNSDWFAYFLATDPAQFLRRVRCPVLALNGSLDLQVIAGERPEHLVNPDVWVSA